MARSACSDRALEPVWGIDAAAVFQCHPGHGQSEDMPWASSCWYAWAQKQCERGACSSGNGGSSGLVDGEYAGKWGARGVVARWRQRPGTERDRQFAGFPFDATARGARSDAELGQNSGTRSGKERTHDGNRDKHTPSICPAHIRKCHITSPDFAQTLPNRQLPGRRRLDSCFLHIRGHMTRLGAMLLPEVCNTRRTCLITLYFVRSLGCFSESSLSPHP